MVSSSVSTAAGACLVGLCIGASVTYYQMNATMKRQIEEVEARCKEETRLAEERKEKELRKAEKQLKAVDTRRSKEIKFLEMSLEKQREIIQEQQKSIASSAANMVAKYQEVSPTRSSWNQ